jgi:MoxR-like ATPase
MGVNAPMITAGEALEVLRAGWRAQMGGQMALSWMLHGRPGIGKTEVVAQLARDAGARLIDLRLTTLDPSDLRGLPYYDHAAGRTVWYRPEDLPDDPEVPTVLFLDELTAAAPALQPVVYGLLQERRVGRHRLPASCFVVAAGNGAEDGAIAYAMGTALSDRLVHLALRAGAADWIKGYALPRGLHPAVVAFIRTRPDLLETTEDALRRGETIFATPRSWARVAGVMAQGFERRVRDAMVAGILGEAVAAEFLAVADEIAATVEVGAMLAAGAAERVALYPASLHGLAALVYGLPALVEARTLPAAIEVLAGLPDLTRARGGDFARMPLMELATQGFELLIARALDEGWEEAFRTSRAYAAHMAARAAAGLA